ncbi:hypothetical protein L3Q82_019095, partial [Scortum barcoo]
MDLNVLLVPLHKVMLDCDLFQGEAELAVRLALPDSGSFCDPGKQFGGGSGCTPRVYWLKKNWHQPQNKMKYWYDRRAERCVFSP